MADNMELVTIYGKVTDEREESAKTLVRIMEYMSQPVAFINALNCKLACSCPPSSSVKRCNEKQWSNNPAADVKASEEKTIFRANSIASKALDYYMKLVGMEYLFCELFTLFSAEANLTDVDSFYYYYYYFLFISCVEADHGRNHSAR